MNSEAGISSEDHGKYKQRQVGGYKALISILVDLIQNQTVLDFYRELIKFGLHVHLMLFTD